MKIISRNKSVNREYSITDKFEAGIVLSGWEVKAVKAGKVSMEGCFAYERNGEIFLKGLSIYPLEFARPTAEIIDNKKLLLSKKEILKIKRELKSVGFTIVPIEIYINDKRFIKVQIGLGKGIKKFDKRAKLKEKDQKKTIDLERKRYNF